MYYLNLVHRFSIKIYQTNFTLLCVVCLILHQNVWCGKWFDTSSGGKEMQSEWQWQTKFEPSGGGRIIKCRNAIWYFQDEHQLLRRTVRMVVNGRYSCTSPHMQAFQTNCRLLYQNIHSSYKMPVKRHQFWVFSSNGCRFDWIDKRNRGVRTAGFWCTAIFFATNFLCFPQNSYEWLSHQYPSLEYDGFNCILKSEIDELETFFHLNPSIHALSVNLRSLAAIESQFIAAGIKFDWLFIWAYELEGYVDLLKRLYHEQFYRRLYLLDFEDYPGDGESFQKLASCEIEGMSSEYLPFYRYQV